MEFGLIDQRMLIFFGILFVSLIVSIIVAAIFVSRMKEEGRIERSLNMVLFAITLPRFTVQKSEESKKEEKNIIAISEQFLTSISEITEKGFLHNFIYGQPYLAFEIAVPASENEIKFYVSASRKFADVVERQIHSFFPDALFERVHDYNPFVLGGYTTASYVTLNKHYAMPIRTFQKMEIDPLGAFTNSLSKLAGKDEGAAIQILIAPAKNWQGFSSAVIKQMQKGLDFTKALSKARGGLVETIGELFEKKDDKKEPKPLTPIQEEEIKAISEKAQKIGFAININLVSSAPTKGRSEEILSLLERGFSQFASPNLNSFKINRLNEKAAERLVFNFSFRLFHVKSKMILNTEELVSVFHFPTPYLETPKIKFLTFKKAPPPPYLPEQGIMIGVNDYRGLETPVKIAQDDRRRHFYVIGQTGTGKSFLMQNMMRQDMENGDGCCYIDPHGEAIEYVLGMVPKGRVDDVVVFDPSDIERPFGLNMLEFDTARPEQKTFIVNELLAILKTIYKDQPEGFGPMFEQYYKNAVLLLLDDYEHEIPTIADIPRVLSDDKYRRDKLSRETNMMVKNFWELEAEKAGGEAALANIVPYIASKLNPFLANDYVRPIVSQQKSTVNFGDIMNNKKILFVNLSKGKIGDLNSQLLGAFIVAKLTQAALSRVNIPEEQRNDFYLYIDEFQNYTTPSISTILSEARKYKLCLNLAHQFIGQLPEDISKAVFGNVGSMAIFRVGPEDAEFLTQFFKPVFSDYDLINLDSRNALIRLLVNGTVTQPFNLTTTMKDLPNPSPEIARAVKELSRLKFGRERAIIEEEIKERYKI